VIVAVAFTSTGFGEIVTTRSAARRPPAATTDYRATEKTPSLKAFMEHLTAGLD